MGLKKENNVNLNIGIPLPDLDTGGRPLVLPQREEVDNVLKLVPLGEASHCSRHLLTRVDTLLEVELLRHHEQTLLPHVTHVLFEVQGLRHGSVPRRPQVPRLCLPVDDVTP